MNPLQRRLSILRLKLRLFVISRGFISLAALLVGAALTIGLADWFLHLPSLIRALCLLGILGATGYVFYRYSFLPYTARCDDLALALRIESQYPQLNDALASTVQFLEKEDDVPSFDSASLRKQAIAKTLEQADQLDFGAIINRRGGVVLGLAAAVLVSAALWCHFLFPTYAEIAVLRLADPFGNHTWTRIDMANCPDKVAQGRPFPLRAKIDGVVPKEGRLEIDDGTPARKDKPVEIKFDAATGSGTLVTGIDMTQHLGKFRFRIHAGDGAYPPGPGAWHEVEVLPPPSFAKLHGQESPQIELRPPTYTGMPAAIHLPPGIKYIQAIAGTEVVFRAAVDRPLEEAWIEFRPENPLVSLAARLSCFGLDDPMASAAALNLGGEVWRKVPARFTDESRKIFTIDFVPPVRGEYHFEMRENQYLSKDFNAELRVVADPAPLVNLLRPFSSMDVVGDANVLFLMTMEDEMFPGNANVGPGAIHAAYLEYRRRNAEGQWLDSAPLRKPLFEHKALGRLMPQVSAALAGSWWIAPALSLRPVKLDIIYHWPLKDRFKEGEIVVVQACAEDFCDIEPGRQPGRSTAIELRIVTATDIAKKLDHGLGEAQKDLVRLQQMQDAAIELVREVQAKKEEGKVTQKEMDKLIEAEQIQRAMQERIGQAPDEGLRGELAKLQQTVKDNKLPNTAVQDRIKTLKTELDRLASEELPQIEPNLTEARKDLANDQKPGPKDKGPLAKAEKHQRDTKKTLDELGKFLEPWASMNEIKGTARELLKQQKDTNKETAKLEADLKKAKGDTKATDDLRTDLVKKGDAQKDMADKAQALLDKMGKAQEQRAKEGDKDAAEKLKNAARIGKDGLLPKNMRDVAEKLKPEDPRMQEALSKQEKNIKKVEQIINALETKKEDDLDRLTKKRKDAGKNQEAIEELAKNQEKLQKKVKDANKIADAKEREKELKKLGAEQEKLQEEAQKNARELARLAEDQASQDLDRAAKEMENAAQKLKEGIDPGEQQDEALDRLENAQAKLQEFEDELAREQLAKIADRIKGLVERQDTALERSKELQKKVLDQKKWNRGLLGTLDNDRLVQEGLATETRSLKDKLKDAKVFEHIFEKAAIAMDKAAGEMNEHKEIAKERQRDMDKEEVADETTRGGEIQQKQALASQRLKRLLDALKNDPPDPMAAQNNPPKKDGDQPDGADQQPKMRPGDGVPPMAQLKALRAEQVEINDRTKALAKQNPDPALLPPAVRRELDEIQSEQNRLHRLFEEMTAPEQKGDQP